jgi:epoxyqueuosine reductase
MNSIDLALLSKNCQELGIHFFGHTDLHLLDHYQAFGEWLDRGDHAGMNFLIKSRPLRQSATSILPSAKSAFVMGLNYHLGDKLSEYRTKQKPWIAQYARHSDYHKILWRRCELAVRQSVSEGENAPDFRVCVDSAPLLERAIAAKVDQGFIGKNTMWIHRALGSYVLLAIVLCDIEAPPSQLKSTMVALSRDQGGCGSCRRCQVQCPTNALVDDYRIDAKRCLSYWTIEHRGTIPFEFWSHIKDYVFGCDLCQLVCPYNRGMAQSSQVPVLARSIDPYDLATLTESEYIKRFAGTPLTRAKRDGLRRNGLIAMAASHDRRLFDLMQNLDSDPSQLIRDTAQQCRDYIGYSGSGSNSFSHC